ncbi:helix-turn-helix domain-containing protein [Brachybacterium huguangmaarense]|uniref:Helix-turn-helix domain-containing protein n=1 Tax=Brachybacterium huguangmaarense TaxID=1652028 RepID=A0ABY6G3A4_9MICO|nr:helix-turn-helix domain-containing protein [Brachybacterium huguangmaarense]UYG17695.1 helix-turn-helix domain-containing protein [Brachybacterium huguangmaarense]
MDESPPGADAGDRRGVLYPARLPTFHREGAPASLAALVRWFWFPRWDLPPGEVSRQELLPFPASNLVVQLDGVTLAGPATGRAHRDLQGRGWAVGALLRPAGLMALHAEPSRLRDIEVAMPVPGLHGGIAEAMELPDEAAGRRHAIGVWETWAAEHLPAPDQTALLGNTMEDLIATDPGIVRIEQVARRLGVSVRGVQRLAHRGIGLPPLAVIRRYRLQEAAQRLREDPTLSIAQTAADLGYADQAHLAHDFRQVLGTTPSAYREGRGA